MNPMSLIVALLCLFVLFGCALEDPETVAAAQTNCKSIINNYCIKVDECSDIAQTDCEATIRTELDCSKAVDTSDSMPACFDDINSMTCGAGLDLPASCKGVIITDE